MVANILTKKVSLLKSVLVSSLNFGKVCAEFNVKHAVRPVEQKEKRVLVFSGTISKFLMQCFGKPD
jgi:hypothetical protein